MDLADKKALKEAWITALTDGSHAQCSHTLHNQDRNSFCCLGVAAHVWGLASPERMGSHEDDDGTPHYEGPTEIYEDLRNIIPIDVDPLVDMNDSGQSFADIAAKIKAEWNV